MLPYITSCVAYFVSFFVILWYSRILDESSLRLFSAMAVVNKGVMSLWFPAIEWSTAVFPSLSLIPWLVNRK